ncbi:MAG TPA: DUF6438 domain-containing protein [Chitinophagaceae bacterium]|jgi:hypothetical protein
MKLPGFLWILLLYSNCLANKIDDLKTIEDVYHFLVKNVDKKFKKNFPLDENSKNEDTAAYARNKFFKVDIDNNHLTDLVLYGYTNFLIVLDNGSNHYTVRNLDRGSFSLDLVSLVSIDTSGLQKKIIVQESQLPRERLDTLVYKFNNFIEYNSNPPANFNIDSISFKTSPCFGTCPIFEMSINKKREVTYKAINFNDETGEFHGTIPRAEFDELLSILKYLQPDRLEDNYSVSWTDDQTATTTINYNGRTKSITDYGEIGTFGLSLLYSKFFIWRSTIGWAE